MNEIEIHVGDEFSTPFETGCIAKSEPEPWGAFDGLDSEGVLCGYMVSMVTAVTRRAGDDSEQGDGNDSPAEEAAAYAAQEAAKGEPLAPWELELIGLPRDHAAAPDGGEQL